MKKYSKWFEANKNKPIGKMIIIVLIATLLTLAINLMEGKPLLKNGDFIIFLIAIYGLSFVISKYIYVIWLQVLSSFVVLFIFLSIEMFYDGSYVDYTSFIVIAGVALLLSFAVLIIVRALSKDSK